MNTKALSLSYVDELTELNRRRKMYYMKFCRKNQDPEIKIYRTMHGIHTDMANILKHGGVVIGVANVSKQAKPMTSASFELSGI